MLLKTSARQELLSTATAGMRAGLHICGNVELFSQEHPDAPIDGHSKGIASMSPLR